MARINHSALKVRKSEATEGDENKAEAARRGGHIEVGKAKGSATQRKEIEDGLSQDLAEQRGAKYREYAFSRFEVRSLPLTYRVEHQDCDWVGHCQRQPGDDKVLYGIG